MRRSLTRLVKRLPPPDAPTDADVDWDLLEEFLGLTYPSDFKDLIGKYGRGRWFDHASFIYDTPKNQLQACQAVKNAATRLHPLLQLGMRDDSREELKLPCYPSPGGLFPFMNDLSGSVYCWLTKPKNPEKWPVYCWFQGSGPIIENMSASQMLIDWLDGKPIMTDLWGNVDELPEERLVFDANKPT